MDYRPLSLPHRYGPGDGQSGGAGPGDNSGE